MMDCIAELLAAGARIPASTYRLQLHEGFTFDDASAVVPYLRSLGAGDVYLSPITQARPHSMHGYDVMRHDRINPELGGQESFDRLSGSLRAAGMGALLDIVPNHMGVGNDAVWWQDVLENGRSSQYAGYFDIDWEPEKPDLWNRILLPVLAKQYGEALESAEIQLDFADGLPIARYFDRVFPIAPPSLAQVFFDDEATGCALPAALRSILHRLEPLPPHSSTGAQANERRRMLKELRPRMREALLAPESTKLLERTKLRVNGVKGRPESFDLLHRLLEAQAYRLASWRTSSEEINYRRFFDVNDLVGLRMEAPEVFAATHGMIRRLLAEGKVTGLRIDHCDGMFNPRIYLERLQKLFVAAKCFGAEAGAAHTDESGIETEVLEATLGVDWSAAALPLYCVVEKILEPGESLPKLWAVQGTSGYDFAYLASQFFIQGRNRARFDRIYADLLGGTAMNPSRIVYESKRNVMLNSLASETHVLTNLLSRIAGADRRYRDFTDHLLETAIRETIACFPAYRTYIDERGQYTDADKAVIRAAIRLAKRRNGDVDSSVFDYLQSVLFLDERGEPDDRRREAALYFALKFQQLTGPVMAKGVEDTSFYVYVRFLSSNEVGSAVDAFGLGADKLHEASLRRSSTMPHSLLATSTHDSKRGEDVRNRLNVLSEMPDGWADFAGRWTAANQALKTTLDDGTVAPDANEEYLIYQTIAGAWPWAREERGAFIDRLKAYIGKALCEGKVNVTWVNPRPEYTQAVESFIDRLLSEGEKDEQTIFVSELERFLEPVKLHGAVNSLAQLVLKATCPGVPDFYQGSELWDLSLVDPDNRRPVNYGLRAASLERLRSMDRLEAIRGATTSLQSGCIKLLTMHAALSVRNEHLAAFVSGGYTPLEVSDPEHLFAYMRGDRIAVAIPRFTFTLAGGRALWPVGDLWEDRAINMPASAGGAWVNALSGERCEVTGGSLKASKAFAAIPVAILVRQ